MRKFACFLILLLLLGSLCGCEQQSAQVVATTLPVYEFTSLLCKGTPITVRQLVTENVSCLHDYTLQVSQMQMLETADAVVCSGAGLEDFLDDVLTSTSVKIDASMGIHIHCAEEGHHHDDHGHSHGSDPHIWLSPENAQMMAQNICDGLTQLYPEYTQLFSDNLQSLLIRLAQLQSYGNEELADLSSNQLITFHDGFHYFASAFGLELLHSVEEESGSEASAAELKELITLVQQHQLPAVFIEVNGSVSAADVIAAETGIAVYPLDMAMSGNSYFDAMYHNINTVKEALG